MCCKRSLYFLHFCRLAICAHVGTENLKSTCELAMHAAEVGIDCVAVAAPTYVKPPTVGKLFHFFYCTQHSTLSHRCCELLDNVYSVHPPCRCHGAVFGGCSPKCSRHAPVLLPQPSCYWSRVWVYMCMITHRAMYVCTFIVIRTMLVNELIPCYPWVSLATLVTYYVLLLAAPCTCL